MVVSGEKIIIISNCIENRKNKLVAILPTVYFDTFLNSVFRYYVFIYL